MAALTTLHVEPLRKDHIRLPFACGTESLDRYFHQQAVQDARRKAAAVFVLTSEQGDAVLGYYTLSATSIDSSELPEGIARKLPRYPRLPAILIGRLAVAQNYQGRS